MASTTVPFSFRGQARRDAAAFYLSQLARAVLAGEVAIGSADRQVLLATSEFLFLEIEARQKRGSNHIEIKLRWPHRPPAAADRTERIRPDPHPPAPVSAG